MGLPLRVLLIADNVRDQRAAGVDIDLTKNRTTAAPLHPMVTRHLASVYGLQSAGSVQ